MLTSSLTPRTPRKRGREREGEGGRGRAREREGEGRRKGHFTNCSFLPKKPRTCITAQRGVNTSDDNTSEDQKV